MARAGGKSAEVMSFISSTDDANGKKGADHKARGADDRKRVTMREKAEAIELLKTMKAAAVVPPSYGNTINAYVSITLLLLIGWLSVFRTR